MSPGRGFLPSRAFIASPWVARTRQWRRTTFGGRGRMSSRCSPAEQVERQDGGWMCGIVEPFVGRHVLGDLPRFAYARWISYCAGLAAPLVWVARREGLASRVARERNVRVLGFEHSAVTRRQGTWARGDVSGRGAECALAGVRWGGVGGWAPRPAEKVALTGTASTSGRVTCLAVRSSPGRRVCSCSAASATKAPCAACDGLRFRVRIGGPLLRSKKTVPRMSHR